MCTWILLICDLDFRVPEHITTSAQVVETSVNVANNTCILSGLLTKPDDHTIDKKWHVLAPRKYTSGVRSHTTVMSPKQIR